MNPKLRKKLPGAAKRPKKQQKKKQPTKRVAKLNSKNATTRTAVKRKVVAQKPAAKVNRKHKVVAKKPVVKRKRKVAPTLVPLTKREKAQRAEQLRLAHAEISRLRSVIAHIKRSEASKRAAQTRRIQKALREQLPPEFVKPTKVVEAWRDSSNILELARKQTYVDKAVSDVRLNEKGWILGTDAHGRPMRAWVVINNQKKDKIVVRWMYWNSKSTLPKRGAFIEDADYESLQPKQYSLFGIFSRGS
jgi:hypothetical protein